MITQLATDTTGTYDADNTAQVVGITPIIDATLRPGLLRVGYVLKDNDGAKAILDTSLLVSCN